MSRKSERLIPAVREAEAEAGGSLALRPARAAEILPINQ